MSDDHILATGFVVDAPGEGSIYPSAGGNSADLRVQAVYWRCLAVFFISAHITNPDLRLVLFTNGAIPVVDGIDMAALFDCASVTVLEAPLTHRLTSSRTFRWGNVLYFLDIMDRIAADPDVAKLVLTDSDVIVTQPLDVLFARLDDTDFITLPLPSGDDEDINGMTRQTMTQAAEIVFGRPFATPVTHHGGELFAARMETWRKHRPLFGLVYDLIREGAGPFNDASTEEHVFSIALAGVPARTGTGEEFVRRIWTSPRHNDVRPGDEALALWHLPAEKRYGFASLFQEIAKGRVHPGMDPDDFRAIAARHCGLPHKTAGKLLHDGVRQVAAKLGLRT